MYTDLETTVVATAAPSLVRSAPSTSSIRLRRILSRSVALSKSARDFRNQFGFSVPASGKIPLVGSHPQARPFKNRPQVNSAATICIGPVCPALVMHRYGRAGAARGSWFGSSSHAVKCKTTTRKQRETPPEHRATEAVYGILEAFILPKVRVVLLSDQGSNLDFLESKSSVLPVTPSDNFPVGDLSFGSANVRLKIFEARIWRKIFCKKMSCLVR